MATQTPRRRLLTLLRRTAKSGHATSGGRSAVEESALWAAHERALGCMRGASMSSARISSSLAKERGAVDLAVDRARALGARAQEMSAAVARVVDAFERLGVVALNTGLEGARLGESAGRALLLVSDEVRAQSVRGAETARDVTASLGEAVADVQHLTTQLGFARDASEELSQEVARAGSICADGEGILVEMGERLRRTTGSDPEVVKAVAAAAEHARALVASLTALSGKVPRALLLGALRPMLDPLVRFLAEDEAEADEGST